MDTQTNVHAEALDLCERYIKLLHKAEAERDEARAEVERLRDVLRGLAHWVANLATDDQLDRPACKTSKSGREWLGEANAEVQAERGEA
jgi:hypothetical protein